MDRFFFVICVKSNFFEDEFRLNIKSRIMKQWNIGMLGIRVEINYLNCQKNLQTHDFFPVKLFHISPGPFLHYSNLGEAPNFWFNL